MPPEIEEILRRLNEVIEGADDAIVQGFYNTFEEYKRGVGFRLGVDRAISLIEEYAKELIDK